MMIGGIYVSKLHATVETWKRFDPVWMLGRCHWILLMVVALASIVVVPGPEGALDWAEAFMFMAWVNQGLRGAMLLIWTLMGYFYGYSDVSSRLMYLCLVPIMALLIMVDFWVGFAICWPCFWRICQTSASHIALTVPLGLSVIYATWGLCVMAQLIKAGLYDYASWKMVRDEHDEWQDGMTEIERDAAGRLKFRAFVRLFAQ